jgi:threonine/homoserine/homoserine lactone efflux protein
MTGDSLLRLYVYGLALAFLTWMLLMGWVVTRSARRYLRRDRSLATAQPGDVGHVGDRHHITI